MIDDPLGFDFSTNLLGRDDTRISGSLNLDSSHPIPPPTSNTQKCIRTFEVTYSRTDIDWHAKPHMIISAISIGSVGTIVLVLFVWIIWRREEFGRTMSLIRCFPCENENENERDWGGGAG